MKWRVEEAGRVAHLVDAGRAICGAPGRQWRAVAGATRCADCLAHDTGEDDHDAAAHAADE